LASASGRQECPLRIAEPGLIEHRRAIEKQI
jgi:hypothetical protein